MEKVSKCRTGSARSKYAAFVRVNKIKHPSLFSCKSHFQLSSTVDVCTPAQHACTSSLRRFSSGPPRSFAGGRYTTGVNGRRFLYSDSMGVHHRGPPVPTVEKHHTKTPSALGSPLSPPPLHPAPPYLGLHLCRVREQLFGGFQPECFYSWVG